METQILESKSTFKYLDDVIKSAQDEVVLVSPFITKSVLELLLQSVRDSVKVTLITRFRIEDIFGGFNDLAIYDLAKQRQNFELRLIWALHAKYYRGDCEVILGSGNLTFKGLSYSGDGNTEVMVKLDKSTKGISEFEDHIMRQSVLPSDKLVEELNLQLQLLKEARHREKTNVANADVYPTTKTGGWAPLCDMPNCLFEVYQNVTTEIDGQIVDQARSDLGYLALPGGLQKEEFKVHVRTALRQSPLFEAIVAEFQQSRNISSARGSEIVKTVYAEKSQPDAHARWLCLVNWIDYFFNDDFQKLLR